MDRKEQSLPEPIDDAAVVTLDRKTSANELPRRESLLPKMPNEQVA